MILEIVLNLLAKIGKQDFGLEEMNQNLLKPGTVWTVYVKHGIYQRFTMNQILVLHTKVMITKISGILQLKYLG